MRILLVNKYYYLRAGAERYVFNLKHLLESKGHTVEIFAMHHPHNQTTTYEKHFVPHVDFRSLSLISRLQTALRVIWYPQAARQIAMVLDDFQPDIVHLCNIYHQLSPSILPPIKKRGIPIVHTLHDYKLICPNYLLYTNNTPCMRCRNGYYTQAIQYRCLHNSFAWSTLAAIEMTLHKCWHLYEHHVNRFIAPSNFVKSTCETFGIPSHQIVHIPHFIEATQFEKSQTEGDYFAYVGRLTPEKGLATLIRAMRHLPHVKLLLVGEGMQRAYLEQMVATMNLNNIKFTGYLTSNALNKVLAQARFTVLPSEWYEVFGLSIIESLLVGKAVIGARIGAIPEVIAEGEDGLLFTPGQADELADCIKQLWHYPEKTKQMGLKGRQKVLTHYNPEQYYQKLFSLYEMITT